jgi:beta propeller repeat protein
MFLMVGNLMPAGATINVAERILTEENDNNCYWPDVSGNYVVYSDWSEGPSNVYVYNIEAGTTIEIGPEGQDNFTPSIDGDRVVYVTGNDGSWSIRMYTISTQTDTEICEVGHARPQPAISGDRIVYRNGTTEQGANEIYAIDLNDPYLTPTQISDAYSRNFRPMVDGDYAVWHAYNGSDHDVMLYDFDAGTETVIADTSDNEQKPDISGPNVVYHVDYGDGGIRYYNIDTQITTQAVDPGYALTPRVDGKFMIYEGGLTGGGQKVIMQNLLTGEETTIADPGNYLDVPGIDGQHVVWVDQKSEVDADIMLDTLSAPPVFTVLPGTDQLINLTPGQVVLVNPFTIQVRPTSEFGIERVEFYIDGVLIGTATTPDANGVYSMDWDTSIYHSTVRVIAYSATGESTALADVTVLTELPFTGR